jgi:hypothetical protein
MALNAPEAGDGERGQAHLIEIGAVGAILVVGVVLTVAVTGVGPSSVAADTEEVNQTAVDVSTEVEAATEASLSDGSLKRTLLLWDTGGGTFADSAGTPVAESQEGQFLAHPQTRFGERLEAFEASHDVRINVNAIPRYQPTAGDPSSPGERGERVPIITRGTPGETTRTVTVSLVLFEEDTLNPPRDAHRADAPSIRRQTASDTSLADASNYPIAEGDAVDAQRVYNAVTIEVVIWDE